MDAAAGDGFVGGGYVQLLLLLLLAVVPGQAFLDAVVANGLFL